MLVSGVAVTDQHSGEGGQDPAVVDVGAGAAADVQQRQVFGAGDVHICQGLVGAAGRFVGVQDRRDGQQLLQVGQERVDQFLRRTPAGPGGEPGGQVQPGQRLHQGGGPPDRQVVRAGQIRAHR